MTGRLWSPAVRRFLRNTIGVDYVIGDPHGCADSVRDAMKRVNFDRERDRMFCVGDLCDRGPQSPEMLKLLAQPWFHSCRGNHEDMLLEASDDGPIPDAVLEFMINRGMGSDWFAELDGAHQERFIEAFRKLPIAMEIRTATGTVGIIHADVDLRHSWNHVIDGLESGDEGILNTSLWGRTRVQIDCHTPVAGIDRIYLGHTPIERPKILGNVVAIDTGAVFGYTGRFDGYLTIVDLDLPIQAIDAVPPQRKPGETVNAMVAREITPVLRAPSAFGMGS